MQLMVEVVWKTELRDSSLSGQVVEVPEGAEFIHADNQNDKVCVWFLCDPSRPKVRRYVEVMLTGMISVNPSGPDTRLVHIGTCLSASGKLVMHVFERVRT
jgi:hypothetical protein